MFFYVTVVDCVANVATFDECADLVFIFHLVRQLNTVHDLI